MTEADVLRIIVSLIFVIMLILAGAWLTRRAGWLRNGKAPALRVLGAQSLGGRAYVALVEVENVRLVLGVTATQVTLLHTLPACADSTAADTQAAGNTPAPAEPGNFASTLNRVLRR